MSILAKAIDACEDATRLVKTIIAFMIANVAVGLAFQAKKDFNIMMEQILENTGMVKFLSNFFTVGFAFMYLVNVGCLLYSFVGLACCRNAIFRERVNETRKCRIIQCVVGPCCATYQQIVIFVTLVNQAALSYVYLMMTVYLGMLLGVCRAGHSVVSSFQGFADDFTAQSSYQKSGWSPLNWLSGVNVEKYCNATSHMSVAATQCFWGCLLSVLSQAMMLMVISEEKGRIEGTMADGAMIADSSAPVKSQRRPRGRDDSDSDSSSGSSSDRPYENDPLKQYKGATSGGRNYKLPGGYQP